MRKKPEWTPQSIQDLKSISDYIYDYNPMAAIDVPKRIIVSVEKRLEKFGEIGRAGRVLGTRELVIPSTPYIAVYRLKEGVIEVLRVYHSARKWPDTAEKLLSGDMAQ